MSMLHLIVEVLTMYFLPLLGFEENVHKKVNSASRLNMLHTYTVLPTEFCPVSNWSPKQHCFGPKRLTKGKDIVIVDKGTAGSVQIKISLTSLDSTTDSTEEFNFIMNIRSNGTGQNTIELNIAK